MIYKKIYTSPLGSITLLSDGEYLTDLFFTNGTSKNHVKKDFIKNDLLFKDVTKWLDIYFSGQIPNYTPKYRLKNLTPFRQEVINELNKIPYGKTITYGDIAKTISKKRNIKKMSAQAVGQAVGWNPICIIIPCHRVMGKNNNLTGYSNGIENKIKLLELEKNTLKKGEEDHEK